MVVIMAEEWVEVAPCWKPRNEGSRLIAKGKLVQDLKAGTKLLIMRNDYATDENRQPQFRIMIVEESGEENICLKCGEKLSTFDLDCGNSYHSECHDQVRQEAFEDKEEEARLNPHQMG